MKLVIIIQMLFQSIAILISRNVNILCVVFCDRIHFIWDKRLTPNESCSVCAPRAGAPRLPSVTRMTQEASHWSPAHMLASDWSRPMSPDITGVSASSRMSTAAFIKLPAALQTSFLLHSYFNCWSKKIISSEERAYNLRERFE